MQLEPIRGGMGCLLIPALFPGRGQGPRTRVEGYRLCHKKEVGLGQPLVLSPLLQLSLRQELGDLDPTPPCEASMCLCGWSVGT